MGMDKHILDSTDENSHLAEDGFNPLTCVLWAQHSSAVPHCSQVFSMVLSPTSMVYKDMHLLFFYSSKHTLFKNRSADTAASGSFTMRTRISASSS